jgi:hypothetical protein
MKHVTEIVAHVWFSSRAATLLGGKKQKGRAPKSTLLPVDESELQYSLVQ